MENINPRLAAALYHQAQGRSIIPAGTDKIPLIRWKQYTTEVASAEQIMQWWAMFPNANPAMVTGAISKLVVLDFDKKHSRSSTEFDMSHTARAKSGNGGEHFYFNYPDKHVAKHTAIFGLGVDLQGDNGLIILPPAVNDNGGLYEWVVPLEEGVADMPEWLSDVAIDELATNIY